MLPPTPRLCARKNSLTTAAPTRWARRPYEVLRRGPERIGSVEGDYSVRGVFHILGGFPCPLLRPTIHPINQIFQLPTLNLRIQDPRNLILHLTFHFHRERGLLCPPR